ncbi:MAG: MFS transporter [Clostridia bacterium]
MDHPSSSRENIRYSALSITYWMVCCVMLNYASVFLLAKGFSNSQIGIILAAGYLVCMPLQSLMAGFADRSRKFSPVSILSMCAALVGIALFFALIAPSHSLTLAAAFLLFMAMTRTMQPLLNAFAFHMERQGYTIRFSIARGLGSLGYAAMTALLGYLSTRLGANILIYAALVALAAMLLLLFRFRGICPPCANVHPKTRRMIPLGAFLHRYRSFLFFLAGTSLLFFGHAAINGFIIQIVNHVGGGNTQMGTLQSYAAVLELPAMFLFDRLYRRFSCISMAKFAAIFFLIKCIGFYFASSMTGLYIAVSMQALSFGLFTPASIRYANEALDPADANKGQAFIVLAISAGSILASALGGRLLDISSVRIFLLATVLVSAMGVLLMAFVPRKPNNMDCKISDPK